MIFYIGPRPVLKGRSAADSINPYTGKAGVYSNYLIYSPSHIFDGAPNDNHVPGTGYSPFGVQMSRWYTGLDTKHPLTTLADGHVLTWYTKFSTVLLREGQGPQGIFFSYGHIDRDTDYSVFNNFEYHGVHNPVIYQEGHILRGIDAPGTANSFGTFGIYTYKGVSPVPLANEGLPINLKPQGEEYGFQRVNEFHGVPSAKALKI